MSERSVEVKFAANDSSDGKNRLLKKNNSKSFQPQKREMLRTVTKYLMHRDLVDRGNCKATQFILFGSFFTFSRFD